MKKYMLDIPEVVVDEIKRMAEQQNRTVSEVFQRFIKLGLLTEKEPIYIMRDGNFVQVDMEN